CEAEGSQNGHQLAARYFGLLPGVEVLYGEEAGGEFVFAYDDHAVGEFVGGLEGLAQAEGSVADFDRKAGGAEFLGEQQGGGVLCDAHGGDEGVELFGGGLGEL